MHLLRGENMKKYTELELKDILEKHSLWLREDRNGERANLRGADLFGANLYLTNLSGANLSGANLSGANLNGDKDINYPINCPEKRIFYRI